MKSAQRPIVLSARSQSTAQLTQTVRHLEAQGVDQIWLEQQPDQRDALLTAATYLSAAPSITVGTAVLPVYARHPVAMAQAAATLAEQSGDRFILGLGYSHKFVNEYVLGLEQGPPIGVMRDYLEITSRLLKNGEVSYEGKNFTAHAQYINPLGQVPLYLAALRPQMIRLAVRMGQGIIIWLSSPRYISEHVMPAVRAACAEFGKDEAEFEVITMLPAYTGDGLEEAAAVWRKTVASYRLLPYYRHVLNTYGTPDPEEFSLIGSPERIQDQLGRFRETGCTPVATLTSNDEESLSRTLAAVFP